ncbi:hypothetical protein [Capnocytophaga bilenii]
MNFDFFRLSFAHPSSHTRLRQLGASRTGFYSSSHTRLRQLADFPSLILRSTFAHRSLKVWWNFVFLGGDKIVVFLILLFDDCFL